MVMLSTIILTITFAVGIVFVRDVRARRRAARRRELRDDVLEQQVKIREGVKKAREKIRRYQDAKKNFISRSNPSNKSDS